MVSEMLHCSDFHPDCVAIHSFGNLVAYLLFLNPEFVVSKLRIVQVGQSVPASEALSPIDILRP